MKKLISILTAPIFAAIAILFSSAFTMSSCEAGDNFNSRIACHEYCSKNFDCNDKNPTLDETDDCVDSCRNSIEDNCGNEHQSAANDQIEECVDKSCVDFWLCMHFDIAPECFGFVGN